MSEAIINAKDLYYMGLGDRVKGSLAVFRIFADPGSTVFIKDLTTGGTKWRNFKTNESQVDIPMTYGNYSITCGSQTINIKVEVLRIYTINFNRRTYGIKIDTTNGDPNGAVTYTDDAVGFTPLKVNQNTGNCNYGSWKSIIYDFIGCKPCLYKAGSAPIYLNPDDYTKTLSGGTADITSGAYDVMVEFRKLWYKFSKTGNYIYFQIANYDRSADGFVTTAFTSENDGSAVDHFYYSAYEGWRDSNNKLRSLSGKTPNLSISYNNMCTYAKNNSSVFNIESYSKRWYITGLFMLVCKGRDGQSLIGLGVVNGAKTSPIASGTLNKNGLCSGRNVGSIGMKFLGIENFWGNIITWITGMVTLSSTTIGVKGVAPYNSTGSGYTVNTDGFPRGTAYSPTNMIVVSGNYGLLASVGQSSYSKGFCDYWKISSTAGYVTDTGGYYSNGNGIAGPFLYECVIAPSAGNAAVGARIVAA